MGTNTKQKKFGFLKGLLWIIAILAVLNMITEGKSTDFLVGLLNGSGSSDNTVQTNAPTQPTEDRLPSVPEALREHVYLQSRGRGSCAAFSGKVTVLVVFVNDPSARWAEDEIAENKLILDEILERIRQDAAAYGTPLYLKAEYVTATAGMVLDRDDWLTWAKSALNSLTILESSSVIATDYEEHFQANEVPIVFCTNQEGRSLAQSNSGSSAIEGALIYGDPSEAYHEICHLFGAKDFYFPSEVKDLAETYLPGSIMSDSSSGSVESLTAYLIGWTDELSSEALQFLEATAYLTPEYLAAQKEIDSFTGYIEHYAMGGGTYTGYLVDGIRHGQGSFLTEDGTLLEGTFHNGHLHGQGTCTWADGAKYIGNYEDGLRSGQGTMHYDNGSVYTGQWSNGSRNGQGKLTFTDGTYCEGAWVDGNLNGEGVYCWSANEKYVGNFVDGKRHGYGVYYFPSGNRYEGEWVSGERHGKGTMYYANGTTQSGTWDNGEFVG